MNKLKLLLIYWKILNSYFVIPNYSKISTYFIPKIH
jgi:hypothetical protein